MITLNNMIIVGGTGRNIGKTTLSEKLIEKFSVNVPVTAVKLANIKPETRFFHGHDVSTDTNKIFIEKETHRDGYKDSMRFLKAGATTSWFIQTEDAFLQETITQILNLLKNDAWIICESNSLMNFIKPALFLMIKGESGKTVKNNISYLFQKADKILEALQWEQFNVLVKRIEIKNDQFILQNKRR